MNRKSIRKEIVNILKNSGGSFDSRNVFEQRSIPKNIDELPAVLIYYDGSDVERNDRSPKSYMESANFFIEVVSTNNNDELLADEMDDLVSEVELALENSSLEETLDNFNLIAINTSVQGGAQSPVASYRLSYECTFFRDNLRTIEPDELKTLVTTYEVSASESVENTINYP